MKLVNTRLLGLVSVITIVACSGQAEPEAPSEAPVAPEAIAMGPTVGPAPAEIAPNAEVPTGGAAVVPGATAAAAPVAAPAGGAAPTSAPAAAAEPDEDSASDGDDGDDSVYAGVYTRAQATRGNQTQQKECGACHSPSDWGGGGLLRSFNGRPVFELVDHVRSTMPLDSPGRLSYQQYTDIIAFFLQLNNVPAGSSELPADESEQKEIKIEYRR